MHVASPVRWHKIVGVVVPRITIEVVDNEPIEVLGPGVKPGNRPATPMTRVAPGTNLDHEHGSMKSLTADHGISTSGNRTLARKHEIDAAVTADPFVVLGAQTTADLTGALTPWDRTTFRHCALLQRVL